MTLTHDWRAQAGLKCTSGAKVAVTKDCSHNSKGAKGGACLFKSKNFVNWTSEGFLHQSVEPNNPGFWECPGARPAASHARARTNSCHHHCAVTHAILWCGRPDRWNQ